MNGEKDVVLIHDGNFQRGIKRFPRYRGKPTKGWTNDGASSAGTVRIAGGRYAAKVVTDPPYPDGRHGIRTAVFGLVRGRPYRMRFRYKMDRFVICVWLDSDVHIAGHYWQREWTQESFEFTATRSVMPVFFSVQGSPATFHLADVEVEQVEGFLPIEVEGTVYEERGGKRKGLEGVLIDSGASCVRTDSQGHFHFGGACPRDFVSVCVPAGYRCVGKYFVRLPDDPPGTWPCSFKLARDPQASRGDVTFVQFNDAHLHSSYPCWETWADSEKAFAEDLREISDVAERVDFAVDAGDLSVSGREPETFVAYMKLIRRSRHPVYLLCGNHDGAGPENDDFFAHFKDNVGPICYSWDFGRYHFVAVSNMFYLDSNMLIWLQKNLAAQPPGRASVIFTHSKPVAEWEDFLKHYDIAAYCTGHYHSCVHWNAPQFPVFTAASFIMGGEPSGRGFRIVRLKSKGRLESDVRQGGLRRKLYVFEPWRESNRKRMRLEVSAYDTTSRVVKVSCKLDSGAAWPLRRTGEWTWSGNFPNVKSSKAKSVAVTAVDEAGKAWTRKRRLGNTAGAPAVDPGTDWPQLMGGPLHDGTSPEPVRLRAPLKYAWTQSVGGVLSVASGCVLVDGRLFSNLEDDTLSKNGGVLAMDARTGKILWRHVTGASVRNAPACGEGFVFGVTCMGDLVALDQKTGREVWCVSRPSPRGEAIAQLSYGALYSDGKVFFSRAGYVGAFKASTGRKLWESGRVRCDAAYRHHVPAYDEGRLLTVSPTSGAIAALDGDTGHEIWEAKNAAGQKQARLSTAVSVGGQYTYVGSLYGTLFSNNRWTGAPGVTWELRDPAIRPPAVDGLRAYKGTELSGRLLTLSARNSCPIRYFQTGKAAANPSHWGRYQPGISGAPVMANGLVYFGAYDGVMYALDQATGRKVWSYRIGPPIVGTPALTTNALFVGTLDGRIHAFTSG